MQVSGPAVDYHGRRRGVLGLAGLLPRMRSARSEGAGAISEGIGQYGNNVVLVTPIEQMLGEPVRPPPDAPKLGAARPRPLLGPLTVGGLSPAVFGLLERAGARRPAAWSWTRQGISRCRSRSSRSFPGPR